MVSNEADKESECNEPEQSGVGPNIRKKLVVINLWKLRCIRAAKGNYYATGYYRALDMALTLINAIASIGVLVLSSANWIRHSSEGHFDVLLGVAGIIVVSTSIAQYILDYRTRWKLHERAAASYSIINCKIEEHIAIAKLDDALVTEVRDMWDRLGDTAPSMPCMFWNRPKSLSLEIIELEAKLTK